jgi:hypothetical protein
MDELLGEPTGALAVHPEVATGAGHQFREVKVSWPANRRSGAPSALGFSLRGAAIIPDEVDRAGLAAQVPGAGPVLDPIAERLDHGARL